LTIEVEIKEIKEMLQKLNRRLDSLVQDREALAMMAISQQSLTDFLTGEPDLYSVKDVKVAYR
jgi:hypothetical protein